MSRSRNNHAKPSGPTQISFDRDLDKSLEATVPSFLRGGKKTALRVAFAIREYIEIKNSPHAV